MTSTFSGISTALSSLYAQRRGLDVTGQNIANANTEGYSRQRVNLQAVGANSVPAVYSRSDGPGSGVSVSSQQRLRDNFMESRAQSEHARSAYLDSTQAVYARIEDVFAEPSDTAIASQLSDFWAAWGDVANDAGDEAARIQLMERGESLTDGLRAAHDALSSQWDSVRVQAGAYERDINDAATAIAKFNETIKQASAAGIPANELADQRDAEVLKLAKLTGATSITKDDGTVDVFLGGSVLVSGAVSRAVVVSGSADLAGQSANEVKLKWVEPDVEIAAGGQLGAALDTLNDILPEYATKLDTVAATLATTVNQIHTAGYGLDGVNNRPFFSGTTATTLQLAISLPAEVAASKVAGGNLGSTNADALGALATSGSGADSLYRQMVVGLGVAAQSADRSAEIQASVVASVDAARVAESGVNLDEEMTNLITYQRAYEAASRVMTTIDGMLDTLINRTGLVGR